MLLTESNLTLQVLFLLLWSIVTAKEHPNLLSSKHNKSLYYSKYRHELFYDNKVIPEDTEVDVFLHKNQVQKLFFVLEGGYRPISITVTPCSSDSLLEWKVSHNAFQNSGISLYHSASWSNHVIRPSSSSPAATYVGRDRRSYTNPRAPPGLYNLELRSESETKARVLVTTRATTDMPFHPPLPPEPGVQIIKIKRNRILISWKASLSSRSLQYCVTSNHKSNYNSLCSAEVDLYGTEFLGHASYHHALTHHTVSRHGATMTCVGRKTWHLFKGLQRGKTYYFDVFVLDTETNASSAYVGVSVTIRNGAVLPSRLKDDSLVTYTLDDSNGFAVDTKYHAGKPAGPILIFIQSCTGPGPVTLDIVQNSSPRKELLSTTVIDVKTVEVSRQVPPPANSSLLLFSIRSRTRHPRKVRLLVSGRKHAFPFPILPHDKAVSVFDTLTTCDSITIGWKASPDERVKYCIYRQAAPDELTRRTLAEPQNFCDASSTDGSTRRNSLVLCRRYHKFSKRRFNNVIMQKVKGLLPGTNYLFEVQVTKVKGKMLPYEQVWATTHDTCSHLRNKR
ncbi:protein NDNF-like [Uloborus diversus]|uniref:protein NDNF-like n=1 Tax=Uloborus diversus TaxID=327109 RepID=UPI00240A3222|nr:protein NDNF-like [Uloborus diversus]